MRAGRALTRARGLVMAPAGDGRPAAPAQQLAALLHTACLASASPVRSWLPSLSSSGLQNSCLHACGQWGTGQALCRRRLREIIYCVRGKFLHSAVFLTLTKTGLRSPVETGVPPLLAKRQQRTLKTYEPALRVAQARRAAALQALERALHAEPGAGAAAEQVVELWTKALPLLGDKAAAVRQAVLPVIGLLGAVATRPGAHTGATHSSLQGTTRKSADLWS